MKKNFLTVAAMAVVAFFVSTEVAKAADISFSGQITTRMEVNEHSGGGSGTGSGIGTATAPSFNNDTDEFIFSRVRLNAHANVNDSTSAFIQLQSVRTWGQPSSAAQTVATGAGSGNASGTANDADATVGVHQAYFILKNFANLPIAMDAKVGRQEIILDGHRLFGNTIWTPGMQSHDAIVLSHAHDNMSLTLGLIRAQEDARLSDRNDANDSDAYLAHLNIKGVLGGQFSGYYVFLDNGCGGVAAAGTAGAGGCSNGENNFHTIGGRQAGQLFGLDYRGEAYYQFGRADGVQNANAGNPDTDRSAYMFGVRVGKSFNNVMFKPGITLWYDYLSGTSDKDQRNGDWNSFNTLFDTGHKFYGLQDLFLGVGGGGATGTRGLGLQDLAVKLKFQPIPGWTFKAAAHAFATAEGAQANSSTAGFASTSTVGANQGGNGSYLGNEYDLSLHNKYNANTNISIGFSNFNGTSTFKAIKQVGGANVIGSNDANWAYVQFDVKF
jgi:hypothetical protein